MSTRRVKLVVTYDGTDFCGWAPQRGLRTVHGTLTEAVRQVSGEAIEITGASRTDSGAHALGQVAHFDPPSRMPAENWVRALGDVLPPDLAAVQAAEAPPDFHARFSARSRKYRYRISTGPRDPFRDRHAWWQPTILDTERMGHAARALAGAHDFRAFGQDLPEGTNCVRTVFSANVLDVRGEVRVEVVGTAFIRGMMRRIAGALWQVGRGKWPPERVQELLGPLRDDPHAQPPVLPAHGLTLVQVAYGRWPKDCRTAQKDLENKENEDE